MSTRAYKSLLPVLAGLIILPSLARAAAATPLYPPLAFPTNGGRAGGVEWV